MRQGRKRKVILGDGNCLFRAVAHIMYGTEDKHATVRQILVRFIWHNRPVFQKYITNGTFEQHAEIVTREGAWGTQVELYVTASYYRLPVYIFSPHPQPTNIDGFFLSLSNVPTLVIKKTSHYYKSITSNYVIPQEIILTVYST